MSETWIGKFTPVVEVRTGNGHRRQGLRPPQLGAFYAAQAHWTVSDAPGTIVMPTGTGKTETMLALLAANRPDCLLIVVPTNALREQIASKAMSFGVLPSVGVIGHSIAYPIVGVLTSRPKSADEVRELFTKCNVVVTTVAVAGQCSDAARAAMAKYATHLFIDEAHHVVARTWDSLRRAFKERDVLQFTATPFRNDRRHVGGRVIFNYPLRLAQRDEYFAPINFCPVTEWDEALADHEIAAVALSQLAADREAGFAHILMARAASIPRAENLHRIYKNLAPDHNPIIVHSNQSAGSRRTALEELRSGHARIVVCVDMLGEGFDLPELKIAALHDAHRSLAITLQFIGRFARSKAGLASATVVANLADAGMAESLRELYAEDADWNRVLRRLSEGETGRYADRSELLEGFANPPAELPLQNLEIPLSAVVYRTKCLYWTPEAVFDLVDEVSLLAPPTINHQAKMLVFVERVEEPVEWGDIRGLVNIGWHITVAYWDEATNLLFIDCSDKDERHERLATAIAGPDPVLVTGPTVFRALQGITRLILTNLGLKHTINRHSRFTMHAGPDVEAGISDSQLANRYKTNLFGRGFENGDRASVGCSLRGRIWSHAKANDLAAWRDWCIALGAKLSDESIDVEQLMRNHLISEDAIARPELVPLAIDWPDEFFMHAVEAVRVRIGAAEAPFYDASIELTDHQLSGPIRFRVTVGSVSSEYEITFAETGVGYKPCGKAEVEFRVGRRAEPLSIAFERRTPLILFDAGVVMEGGRLYRPAPIDRSPFDAARMEAWDWTGTDIRVESQTIKKDAKSIQYRVLQHVLHADPPFDLVIDDDDAYEAADVVAMRVIDDRLVVEMYHCKYSSEDKPGGRVKDLYAVAGQAQRSVRWRGHVELLFRHLAKREDGRVKATGVSRIERGSRERLKELWRRSVTLRPDFTIYIVQPGLSRSAARRDQLDLLSATEVFLRDTYNVALEVIGSA